MKAVAALAVSAPDACEVMLSGRLARVAGVRDEFARRLAGVMAGVPVRVLTGFADVAKQAAQGAALIADGLAGGASAALVDALRIREASGTVLDHLYVITLPRRRARASASRDNTTINAELAEPAENDDFSAFSAASALYVVGRLP